MAGRVTPIVVDANLTVALAAYLAVAARLGADFWTADRRLAERALAAGLDWVHWLGAMGGG